MQLTDIKRHTLLGKELNLNTITLYTLYTLSFLIPLLISKPQLLVGSAINLLITYSTLKYGFKKTFPILLTPSLVATGTGLLFGGATLFLVYLMPFIMISNILLSYSISKKKNILGILIGIFLKVIFLYTATYILVQTIGLPSIFLTSMGLMQIYTALIGGSIGFGIFLLTRDI
jgi:hypothetical protein